jgi:hypothetical protein
MLTGFAVATFNDGTVSTLAAIMTVAAVLTWGSYLWARGSSEPARLAP